LDEDTPKEEENGKREEDADNATPGDSGFSILDF
jgi:hypothetical protein